MEADVFADTAAVVMVAVVLVAPAGTVTFAGRLATATLLEVSATTTPPMGAAPEICIVAMERLPPMTDAGFNVSAEREGGLTDN